MSMSRGCEIIESKPGEWYCVVAQHEYDYEFRDGSTVYGPSKTSDEAFELMGAREANPGSSDTLRHAEVGDRERNLIANAIKG